MLARLRMTVDEAFDEFSVIVEQVYSQKIISPSERTMRLRKCLEDIMRNRGLPLDMKLMDETSSVNCPCFVMASLRLNAGTNVSLRGYRVKNSPAIPITVIDAALATCATQPHFAPIISGQGFRKKEYIAAGVGASNPTRETIIEAHSLFGANTNVASLLSLGNGHPGIITFPSGELGLSKVIWDMMNDCTQRAREIEQHIGSTGIYFRFSVEQGMQNEHVDQVTDPSWILAQTESYTEDPSTSNKLEAFIRSNGPDIPTITLEQLKSGHVPSVSIQLPSHLEKRQLNVVVTDPEEVILKALKPAGLEYGSRVAECMEGTRRDILQAIHR